MNFLRNSLGSIGEYLMLAAAICLTVAVMVQPLPRPNAYPPPSAIMYG